MGDAAGDSADAESRNISGGISDGSSASQMHVATAEENKLSSAAAAPSQVKGSEGKKEGAGQVASHSSKQLAGSNKLEDQINLQHLVELMKIFYVSRRLVLCYC